MGGKVLVPTSQHIRTLTSARLAADALGVPTVIIARTDALAANLLTSDVDDSDKDFVLGERTSEGFFKVKNGTEAAFSRALSYAPYADLVWCETGTPDIGYAKDFADAVHEKYPDKFWSWFYISRNKFTYENKQLKKKEAYWLLEGTRAFNRIENLVISTTYM